MYLMIFMLYLCKKNKVALIAIGRVTTDRTNRRSSNAPRVLRSVTDHPIVKAGYKYRGQTSRSSLVSSRACSADLLVICFSSFIFPSVHLIEDLVNSSAILTSARKVMDNAEDFSTSTQLSSKNTRGIRDPIYVNEEHDSDHEDNHEHHHHHDEDDEYIYKFSIKQMYIDTMNLDWSKVIWNMVICDAALHLLALGGLYLCIMGQIRGNSILFTVVSAIISGLGVTMGVHRLWAHRSYKAVFAVRLVLMCLHCVAFQHSIFSWSVNHRVHHKWPDTDRDLTNSRRGFFFAHMGWR
ncbi:stearoyl-CoA desaturase-like, partial [Hyalella azteca]|uniref:Stearoyl-CoA desaturase-like n=1 Tax=Hyalella azteca TaxID=294128 RepID=A0A979FYB0_HYAAZ